MPDSLSDSKPVDNVFLGKILGKPFLRQKPREHSSGRIGRIDFHNHGKTAVLSAVVTPGCAPKICVINCGDTGTTWRQRGEDFHIALGEKDFLIIPGAGTHATS